MARQHPWYTPGQPASAAGTWPLEDPYGEPGPGPAEQQDQQPAVPGPGSLGGGFVPAASSRMRRSPARPPAPRKARAARNTPLRPGRVLIAAALAGLAAGAGIAASAGQPAIRLAPADNPAATSQYTPTAGPAATPSPAASSAPPAPNPSPSAGAAEPPAISTAAARRVLASYWAANNRADKARSDTLLARIEAGTSYQMDAGAYRTGRAAGPASGYTPVTAQNPVLWIPRQPAGTYPRWFAARVTYTGEGAGYLVFTQPQAGAPWKNVLEPYLLHGTGPGPFVTTDASGYAAQADPDAAGLAVTPAQIEEQTAASLDGAAAAVGNPGNLADMRDEAYFAAHLPPGSAARGPPLARRDGVRRADHRRRGAGVLQPDRRGQPHPAARPGTGDRHPWLLHARPASDLDGDHPLRRAVRRLPPSRTRPRPAARRRLGHRRMTPARHPAGGGQRQAPVSARIRHPQASRSAQRRLPHSAPVPDGGTWYPQGGAILPRPDDSGGGHPWCPPPPVRWRATRYGIGAGAAQTAAGKPTAAAGAAVSRSTASCGRRSAPRASRSVRTPW